ncbi:hypothetical protein CBS101457_002109 [Exobasidium rhododendri]|nr:hypothetical protein CBS101457_002109 [Exobasidium rhododendri]
MSLSRSKINRTATDDADGEGDLGLQAMHLDNSPPARNRPFESPPGRPHTLQVIKSRFGSQGNKSRSSISSSSTPSYFSSKEDRDVQEPARSPISPDLPVSTATAAPQTPPVSPNADSSDVKTQNGSAKANSSKSKTRFSKLRKDGPLTGDSKRPSITPRTTSTATSASTKAEMEGARPPLSSATSNGDLSSPIPKSESLTLTSGTSPNGLLADLPLHVSSRPSSASTSNSVVAIPGRATSLAKEKIVSGKREDKKPSFEQASQRAVNGAIGSRTLASGSSVSGKAMDADVESIAGSSKMALQRWVLSVGCVNFDLDKGPDLEFLYPSLGISREERDNIAFSSFPDTSIFDDGQAVFSWRVREVPLDSSGSEAPLIAGYNLSSSPSKASMSKARHGSHTRSSTLPGKVSPGNTSAPTSPGHKIWKFERSWMPSRSMSSDDTNEKGEQALHRSSPGTSPKPSKSNLKKNSSNNLATPASPPSEVQDEKPPIGRIGSNATTSSTSSGERGLPAMEGSEAITANKSHQPAQASSSTSSAANVVSRVGRSSRSSNFIHGYCFFRQRKDATIRRGYFQKSVVILSHLPYVSLFSEIVKRLGPLYFQNGMAALEAFSQDIQNWPPPEPGARMHLPLLGSVISVDLPFHSKFQTSLSAEAKIIQVTNTAGKARSGLHVRSDVNNRTAEKNGSGGSGGGGGNNNNNNEEPILASIPLTPLFELFRETLDDLWLLWECLLLAEPILVVGPDPRVCSEAVWHLLDLIRPIPFAGDFRPFFTIHDYDFQTLITKNKPNAGVILGVTNPFMLQACKHWPHVFKVGKAAIKMSARLANRKSVNSSSGGSTQGASSGGGGGIAGGNSAGGGGPEHVPGLLSKRKRRVSKDRPLLRELTEMAEKGGDVEAANAMLRRYFSDLTEQFLAPLNRYVSSLIPADFDLSSPSQTPRIKPFNSTAFLASLKANGTPLPIRSRNLPTGAAVRQSLYHEFIQCPNFSLWLHERISLAEEEQYNRKLKALESGNILEYVSKKTELETIDLYSRLKTEIHHIDEKLIQSKRDRELEPNSRWKTSLMQASSSSATVAAPIRESFPALALSTEPLTLSTAKKIDEQIRTSGNTLTTGEKSLLTKKIHLIEQLDTLIKALSADLRDSLQLKNGGRQR